MNQQYPQQTQSGQGFGFDVNAYEPGQTYENLPLGWYNVLIKKAEILETQGTGKRLALEYSVYGGPFHDRTLFDNLNIFNESEQAQDIARRALRSIQDAIQKMVTEPLHLVNNYMCVKVGLDKPKKNASDAEKQAFEPRNVVRGYKVYDQALQHTNSQAPQQQAAPQFNGPQTYSVQVQPQNAVPNFQTSQPMPQQSPQPQNMQPPGQQYPQQQPQPMGQPPQQQYQQPPQQAAPNQQYAPQPGQNPQQPNNVPPQGNPQEYAQGPQSMPQGQAMNAPGAMGPGGQQSHPQVDQSAAYQTAPPATFAPNNAPPQGNVPPPQQQAPQQSPQQSPSGNAMPPSGNTPPPQQQMNQPPQQQQAAPNQQYAPPQGQPPQNGTPPPPGAAW
jgi:hypothetical protein